jgi:hypothetical protein
MRICSSDLNQARRHINCMRNIGCEEYMDV